MVALKDILCLMFIAGVSILIERRIQDAINELQKQNTLSSQALQSIVDDGVEGNKIKYEQLLEKYQTLTRTCEDRKLNGCDNMLINGKNPGYVSIKTSSTHSSCKDQRGYTINSRIGPSAWCSATNTANDYVEISSPRPHIFRGIVTQGRHSVDQWVTKYRVFYSENCVEFNEEKTYSGNWDRDTIVIHLFSSPILARCIRINPIEWLHHVSMRYDVIGCEA